ncbi:MAG: HD domain-containing protein [Planctomycetes bacterium]|nr:HD domain-containing protein [Planctomycetota bacterium]
MRQKLVDKMKDVFGDDQRRIDHALAVLNYAETIQSCEGGRLDIVAAAAILHDIGIHAAEKKYRSTAGYYQEIEGPPIAEAILTSLAWPAADIEHVCAIVGSHHSGNKIDTPEFRCIWDADWIVNLGQDYAQWPRVKKQKIIDTAFRTQTGRQIAAERYLQEKSE